MAISKLPTLLWNSALDICSRVIWGKAGSIYSLCNDSGRKGLLNNPQVMSVIQNLRLTLRTIGRPKINCNNANGSRYGHGATPKNSRFAPIVSPNSCFIRKALVKWSWDTPAAALRRAAAKNFLVRSSGITMGLVGVTIRNSNEISLLSEVDEVESGFEKVRQAFCKKWWETPAETEMSDSSLEQFDFQRVISKGCNAAVYEAMHRPSSKSFAVKVMFNYETETDAMCIWNSFKKECIPFPGNFGSFHVPQEKHLDPHPSIVKIYGVFADATPLLSGALDLYPSALPSRLYPRGLGRNMTLFVVMKKYDSSLRQFLERENLSSRTSLVLLTQLFEGISFLVKNQVAHRDLKTDNILLDLSCDPLYPRLVICDFGCCLTSLSLHYTSSETSRGGNAALMPPEVSTATPTFYTRIDYSSSDLWAAGCIAYEIFGGLNPFYSYLQRPQNLMSSTYSDDEIPTPPVLMSQPLKFLLKDILKRNPSEVSRKLFKVILK